MTHLNHNNPRHSIFQPNQLVFFAKPIKSRAEEFSDTERQMMQNRILEQGAKLPDENKPVYKHLAEQFNLKKGYKEKTLREIYEIATDPDRSNKRYYQDFLASFASGKFSRKGDLLETFLKSLERIQAETAGKNEEKETKQILRRIIDGVGEMGERLEKNYAKQIKRAQEEDEKQRIEQTTGGTAKIIVQTAETAHEAEKNIEHPEEIKFGNWTLEAPPKGVLEAINKADLEIYELVKTEQELNTKHKELKAQAQEKEAAKIHEKLLKIDAEIDKIRERVSAETEEYEAYLRRVLSQHNAIADFSRKLGVADVKKTNSLVIWSLVNNVSKTGEALGGIAMDSQTGLAKRTQAKLNITGIGFNTEDEGIDPESPGRGAVYFENEKGKPVESGFPFLENTSLVLEGYEEIKTPAEFDAKFVFEMAGKKIQDAVGETFIAQKAANLEQFKIVSVEKRGSEWKVILDKSVIKVPKEKIPASAAPALYFDRIQKEFSLGEFGALLKKQGYVREVPAEEMQAVVDAFADNNSRICNGFMEGASPTAKKHFEQIGGAKRETFSIPQTGEETKIEFLDNGLMKKGILRRKNGGYEIETNTLGSDGRWGMPILPAAALAAKFTAPKTVVRKRDLNTRNLMQMANKGLINNAQTQTLEEGEEETAQAQEKFRPEDHAQETPPQEKIPVKDQQKGKYYKEALDYSVVYKVGGMEKVERGFLSAMWAHTRFLSVNDCWELGKALYEYYVRRFERRQKEKYAKVAKDLPFFAPEMQRVMQAAENEQVEQFKQSMVEKGIYEVQERLNTTHNTDEMKAAFMTLADKGQLRWDDINMWRNLNKKVDPSLAIPIPSNGDPDTRVSDKDERTGFAFLKDAIDSLWGEGTYNNWFYKNKSTFHNNAKGYYEKGKELEGVQGGHARRLAELLRAHKEGRYVDPHEYEGLLLHAIDAGKAVMQTKIYYMIEGVAAENHEGRTILSFDRIAHINSEMLNQFPILEYLCAEAPRKEGLKHRFTIDDYKQWVGWFDEGKHMNFRPTKTVDDFMWEYAIPSSETQNRINKALRNGEKLDHDDMFAYLPPATEQILTDACGATSGSKKFLTTEGYANAFPGFSQYIRSLSENDNRKKLVEAIKSWVRFEGIMTWRFEKEKGNALQRMDTETLNGETIVSATTPQKYMGQLDNMMESVVEAYADAPGGQELREIYNLCRTDTGDIGSDPEEMKKQKRINFAFTQFGAVLERVMQTDNAQKLKNIIDETNLIGMPFKTEEEKAQRRKDLGLGAKE